MSCYSVEELSNLARRVMDGATPHAYLGAMLQSCVEVADA